MSIANQERRILENRPEDEIDSDGNGDDDVEHIDEEDENLKPSSSSQPIQPDGEKFIGQQQQRHHSGSDESSNNDSSSSSSSSSSDDDEADQDGSDGEQEVDNAILEVKWGAEEEAEINNRPLWQALRRMEEETATTDEKDRPLHELALLAGEEKEAPLYADFNNNIPEEKTKGPLHELALLAAGEEKEAPFYAEFNNPPAITDKAKGPLHELALLAGVEKGPHGDEVFIQDTRQDIATAGEPAVEPTKKKRAKNPLSPSLPKRQKSNRTEPRACIVNKKKQPSSLRQQWHVVLQQRSKSKELLEAAKIEYERAQVNLDASRQQNQQAEQAVADYLSETYLPLIQEDPSWYDMYQQLQRCKNPNGYANVDRKTNKLANWSSIQRRLYRQQQLDLPKIYALEQIGFDWDPAEAKWKTYYALLQKYVQKHGHAKVPYDDKELGVWIKRQSYQYKLYREDRKSEITPRRIKLLEDVGMVWSRRKSEWMERFKCLQAFKTEHGHVNVSTQMDPSLHEWVCDQRTQLRKRKQQELMNKNNKNSGLDGSRADDTTVSALTKEQVDLLQEIGVDIDVRDSRWQKKWDELREFQRIHGHCNVPKKYAKNQALANWVGTQRRQYKQFKTQPANQKSSSSSLTDQRIAKLMEIGFEFDPSTQRARKHLKATWEEQFASLKTYYERKGNLNVPHDSSLGKWWEEQKQQNPFIGMLSRGEEDNRKPEKLTITRNDSQLPEDQMNQVKELLILVKDGDRHRQKKDDKHLKTWEDYFEELLSHRIYSGSYQIPSIRTDLQNWVDEQKHEYLKFKSCQPSKLTSSHVSRLRAIKFPFKAKGKRLQGVVEPSWEEMYLQLLQFRVQFNTFQVPPDRPALFNWVKDQQTMFEQQQVKLNPTLKDNVNAQSPNNASNGTICQQRLAKLRKVGFPFAEATSLGGISAQSVISPKPTLPELGGERDKKPSSRCEQDNIPGEKQPEVDTEDDKIQQQQQQQPTTLAAILNSNNNPNPTNEEESTELLLLFKEMAELE